MPCSDSPSAVSADDDRYDRLRCTQTFREGAHQRYASATLGVVGAGLVGGPFATEAVRSGASVFVSDPERAELENLGTQPVRSGRSKVESVIQACDDIVPGRARGVAADARHVGVGVWRQCGVIVDATDNPALAGPLTELSNGLGIPLLRAAVDGSGQREFGRVLASHGGAGHACQLCSYRIEDLNPKPRTPCPGAVADARPPTRAGNGAGMAVTGMALLQSQRLLGGNDVHLVLDREVLLDLDHWTLTALQLRRSDQCVSGHESWSLTHLARRAAQTTLGDLFAEAERRMGGAAVALEPYGHPFCLEAVCDCGARQTAVGAAWAEPPSCRRCGRRTTWRTDLTWPRVNRAQAEELGVLATPLHRLGLPQEGAMVIAYGAGKRPLRFLLE